ncbi:hypothetical protein [Adhaeribacter arboris]|nr:hypothetical protein [Adhaeribacter arboris]
MTNKTDEELENYLVNIWSYSSRTISAALNELQNRGRSFTEEELAEIHDIIRAKKETEPKERKEEDIMFTSQWPRNLVTDPDAPAYYSPRVIWGFSIFLSVLFGAVLLSLNIVTKKAKWIVIGFGFLYTTAFAYIFNSYGRTMFISFIINAIGASILTNFFWNKYIGRETIYRARSIKTPVIFALIILGIFILSDRLSRGY